MRSLPLATVFLFAAAVASAQTAPAAQTAATALRDGEQMTFTGRLTMEPLGRLQFVTVKKFGAHRSQSSEEQAGGEMGEVPREIALAGYDDYDLLYQHRGQPVTVTGRLAVNRDSPYYWQGAVLAVGSVRLGDGEDLAHARGPAPQPIAADTGSYQASVRLPDDLAAPWRYSMGGQPAQKGRFLSCSSNGGGDVVNCYCANGFHPQEVFSRRPGEVRPGDIILNDVAQVDTGDVPVTLEITVTCAR